MNIWKQKIIIILNLFLKLCFLGHASWQRIKPYIDFGIPYQNADSNSCCSVFHSTCFCYTWESLRIKLKYLGLFYTCWRTTCTSWLLASIWISPSHCGQLAGEPVDRKFLFLAFLTFYFLFSHCLLPSFCHSPA